MAEVGRGVARLDLVTWRAKRPLPVIGATAVLPRVVRELQTPMTMKVERSDTGGPGSLSVKWAASGATRVTPVPSTWQPNDLVVRWAVKCPMSNKGSCTVVLRFLVPRFPGPHVVELALPWSCNTSTGSLPACRVKHGVVGAERHC